MSRTPNKNWKLQSFINSLVGELDKARDTLAYKSLQQPLSYDVKNLSLELQLFPEFDGREVRFKNAKTGETGASRISLELGSISDRQIRETTRAPVTKDELPLEEIDDIEPEIKESLEKVGIRSVEDIELLERQNLNVGKMVERVHPQANPNSYANLADRLKGLRGAYVQQQSQISKMQERKNQPPVVKKLEVHREGLHAIVTLQGEQLAIRQDHTPTVSLDGHLAEVLKASANFFQFKCLAKHIGPEGAWLEIWLDPHAILKFTLKWSEN